MAWSELPGNRTRRGRLYQDGRWRLASLRQCKLRAADGSALDLTVTRGADTTWRANAGDYSYSLAESGWAGYWRGSIGLGWQVVGFGHLYNGAYTSLLSSPNYRRQNISASVATVDVGPAGELVKAGGTVNWASLWTGIGVAWDIDGERMKERVPITATRRGQITAPATPYSATYTGVLYAMEYSALPALHGAAGAIDLSQPYTVAQGERLRLVDGAGAAFGYFGPDRLILDVAATRAGRPELPLLRYLWRDGTTYYMFAGARYDQLTALPAGGLIYDPSITTEQVGASADDASEWTSAATNQTSDWFGKYDGTYEMAGVRFQSVPVPKNATIDTCTVQVRAAGGATLNVDGVRLYCEAADDAAAFATSGGNTPKGKAKTTAYNSVPTISTWTTDTWYAIAGGTALKEVVDRAGWASGNDVAFLFDGSGTTNGKDLGYQTYDSYFTSAPKLDVTYTEAALYQPRPSFALADMAVY